MATALSPQLDGRWQTKKAANAGGPKNIPGRLYERAGVASGGVSFSSGLQQLRLES